MGLEEHPEIRAAAPSAFTLAERAVFDKLVRAGGEVGGTVLADNIINARALITARRQTAIQGIGALKCPKASYRKRIGGAAGADLSEAAFPFELGYIFVVPTARRKGLSHRLVAAALEQAGSAGVFATARTDNMPMLAALAKAGFAVAGHAYPGRNATTIQLLLRPAGAP